MFEIGRRLKHVKENDLVHGEFINWVENSLNMDRTTASKFMKISKELSNDEPVQHLGFKALYQIATIPEDKREEKHKTSSGEMKNSYEMTTKEREDFKRHQRKLELEKSQLESQLEQAQRSESIAHKQLEKYISIHNIYRR
ncbi:DUF3102 domain-containing protein [Staphylococcus saprophyticus]|uniref:DUF3102 domain-containing protein n=1 Tax=Staphylococcus saprophyticus TaxID=29385 RepID=UPI001D013F6E|nr:DUF3102 domain-containing protein [Staphylococcus saprophyticus]